MDDPALEEALVRWEAGFSAGNALTPSDLCPDRPDLHEPLRLRIDRRRFILRVLHGPLFDSGACDPPAPASIRGFELLEELGRGGAGVVYRALQVSLGRVVAIKMLRLGGAEHSGRLDRLEREAMALARVKHPNVVPIYEFVANDTQPFLVLEYVEGGNLLQTLERHPLPPRDAATLLVKLCGGLEAAHRKGILHRDLKPANVLLATDGTPKITDFGISKLLDNDDAETPSGDILGTPSYMAPEQIKGNSASPATDIYSLGAILYESLTGRAPFHGANKYETLELVVADEPPPPRKLQPRIPPDLETICLKCLRKKPQQRYASAAELSADLERFLRGDRILARPESSLERAGRAIRRRPVLALAGCFALIAVASLGAAARRWDRVRTEAEASERARALVEGLLVADPAKVEIILAELKPIRHWANVHAQAMLANPATPLRDNWRAALVLLPKEPALGRLLVDALPICGPADVSTIGDALKTHAPHLAGELWRAVEDLPPERESSRLRLAGALARVDADNQRWKALAPRLLSMLKENPLVLGAWATALEPAGSHFVKPLASFCRGGEGSRDETLAAANLLGYYGAHAPAPVADLVPEIDAAYARPLLGILRDGAATARPILEARVRSPFPMDRSEQLRDRWAMGVARAAACLVGMGADELAWPLLQTAPDPRVRTYLIHELHRFDVDPAILMRRLLGEANAGIRAALLLAVGEYPPERFAADARAQIVERLLGLYRDDPSGAVHGAVGWLLRHRWNAAQRLVAMEASFPVGPSNARGWFVSASRSTWIVFPAGDCAAVGSPPDEAFRVKGFEARRNVQLSRAFAVGDREVTVGEFAAFLKANPKVEYRVPDDYAPASLEPVRRIDLLQAMKYCRWLGEKEGLPEKEQCYPPIDRIVVGMTLAADHLTREGYRLPTPDEWEIAGRAGTTTPRHYGHDPAMMSKYGWHLMNSNDRAHQVGLLKPNDAGLFDTIANVWEWNGPPDPSEAKAADRSPIRLADGEYFVGARWLHHTVLRGGSFWYHAPFCRSARHYLVPARMSDLTTGFRVARTLRSTPPTRAD